MADEIFHTEEQIELLLRLVEKDIELRRAKKDRTTFAGRTFTGAFLLVDGEEIEVDYNDWVALCDNKLVTVSGYSGNGEPYGAISAKGIAYAQQIRLSRGIGPSIMEKKQLWLTDETRQRYPDCVKLLEDAASLFWGDNRDTNLTTIGHKCREALQDFSSSLYEEVCPDEPSLPKDKTRNKLKKVVDTIKPRIGATNHDLADALLHLWEVVAVDKLAQKVDHGGQREGKQLHPVDAERLLLYSHLVMAELDQLVHSS